MAVIFIITYIFAVERQNLASILMVRPKSKDLGWAGIFWGIVVGWNWTINMIIPLANEGLDVIINLHIMVIIAIIFTTAITEEIPFRGSRYCSYRYG